MAWFTQQTGPANNDTFITSLATLSLSNKFLKMHAAFCTFFGFGSAKTIEISKI